MNKEFKYLPTSPVSPNATAAHTLPAAVPSSALDDGELLKKSPLVSAANEASSQPTSMIVPLSTEVPVPPLVEKEKSMSKVSLYESAEDDVGDTVDIPLN